MHCDDSRDSIAAELIFRQLQARLSIFLADNRRCVGSALISITLIRVGVSLTARIFCDSVSLGKIPKLSARVSLFNN